MKTVSGIILVLLFSCLVLAGCPPIESGDSGGGDSGDIFDFDGDGYQSVCPGGAGCGGQTALDCDDTDAGVNPGSEEICGDGIDQDCDGEDVELDGRVCEDCACIMLWGPVCVETNEGFCYASNEACAALMCAIPKCHPEWDMNGDIDPNSECVLNHPGCENYCGF